jgi:hypothetical protein
MFLYRRQVIVYLTVIPYSDALPYQKGDEWKLQVVWLLPQL